MSGSLQRVVDGEQQRIGARARYVAAHFPDHDAAPLLSEVGLLRDGGDAVVRILRAVLVDPVCAGGPRELAQDVLVENVRAARASTATPAIAVKGHSEHDLAVSHALVCVVV